ncbi:MAG: tRNA (adenosine(37)-N6)-threonylcarbamoyltransferase complex ATPase subunit type 1 TsaE [Candidatus Aminicenantes bacterium]|jgi:tRNA threonylcarbamoyladenosine biosynthesis protein TsaE
MPTHISRSEEETFQIAHELSGKFKGDEVVLLFGELGAGKTVFAKGIASGLGFKDHHHVCSPSFTLVNIYQAKYPIYHVDLYRLGKTTEIQDLGWEDYIGQGIVIVEWAEKLSFPLDAVQVHFEVVGENQRKLTITL